MTVTPLNLNPLAPTMPAIAPRSAMVANYPEASGYAIGSRLEEDTFAPVASPKAEHRNRYQEAIANQQKAPWYKRIGVNAIIYPAAIVGAGLAMHQIGKLPAIKNATEHHNGWVRYPAQFAKFMGEWAIMDALIEFATIGFWSHFW